jgi:hypothetical protein
VCERVSDVSDPIQVGVYFVRDNTEAVMFSSFHARIKDDKDHRYWSVVENRRCGRGKLILHGPGQSLLIFSHYREILVLQESPTTISKFFPPPASENLVFDDPPGVKAVGKEIAGHQAKIVQMRHIPSNPPFRQ